MPRESYAKAGVDLRKVRSIQSSLATLLASTFSNREGKAGSPLIPIGHYAGVVDLGGGKAIALHTDGVGSKVIVAQQMERFDTVGIDCIAMTVNDLICIGAEPVAILDYIALQREDEGLVAELTEGLVKGARLSGTAIVGGETAILGDVIKGPKGHGFDLVSMGAGLVGKELIIDGSAIRPGDVVLGVESTGLHSNGYTLARRVLRRLSLDETPRGLSSTLGETLLTPTRVYVKPALEAFRSTEVHGVAHITGGGFSKLTRLAGRRNLQFDIELQPPRDIFSLIQTTGNVSDREMYRTFNMGTGLCIVVPESETEKVSRVFAKHSMKAGAVGKVRKGSGVIVNGVRVD